MPTLTVGAIFLNMVITTNLMAQEEEHSPVQQEDDAEEGTALNPDESADDLNSQQQLQQSFTLKRSIDGELVQSEKRTITYSRDDPFRKTEAQDSVSEQLLAAFDGEVLTRTEAFEEARLDFTIADKDRDEVLTEQEFTDLVVSWQGNEKRDVDAPTKTISRQRQYDAFLSEITDNEADTTSNYNAQQKFAFLAGEMTSITRKEYIREYLLEFDSMDVNRNALLEGEELLRFRAINRGESISN